MLVKFYKTAVVVGIGILVYFLITVPLLLFTSLIIISILIFILAFLRNQFSQHDTIEKKTKQTVSSYPFISIHIAICNEPPNMVINTLRSALAINYPNYEVIVLDNNTKDKQLWKPVENFSKHYHDKIKFRHFEKLSGFKAGALNECLKISHPETKYIFTVDADYQVEPECLITALAETQNRDFALVQFPQYYLNQSKKGILKELDHFFKFYARSGNKNSSTLPTGTLSFIKLDALRKVGGWPTNSLTEDARLGLDLLHKNFKTRYSNRCIGKGIIPGTLEDLRKQRNRWVYGNVQCLKDLLRLKMPWKSKFSAFMQLTAWVNLLAFPIISSLLYIILSIFNLEKEYHLLPLLIFIQFGIFILGKLLLLVQNRKDLDLEFRAFLVHLALSFEMAFAFWPVFLSRTPGFIRTCKFRAVTSLSSIPLKIPLILAIISGLLMYQGQELLAISFFVLFSIFLSSSLYIYHEYKPVQTNLNVKTESRL